MFEAKNPSYHGPERRRIARRGDSDRRVSIRFEPGNDDRRRLNGRRIIDSVGRVWQREL